MSNMTLWARPAWEIDRWVKEGVLDGFTPAAEIAKDGEDAVVRLELPGVDVAKDVNVELDRGRLVIHGERRDERVVQAACARHHRRDLGVVRRRRADRTGRRCPQGRRGPAHRDREQVTLATPSPAEPWAPPDLSSGHRHQVFTAVTQRPVVGLIHVVDPTPISLADQLVSELGPQGDQRWEAGQHEVGVAFGR